MANNENHHKDYYADADVDIAFRFLVFYQLFYHGDPSLNRIRQI